MKVFQLSEPPEVHESERSGDHTCVATLDEARGVAKRWALQGDDTSIYAIELPPLRSKEAIVAVLNNYEAAARSRVEIERWTPHGQKSADGKYAEVRVQRFETVAA